MSFVLDIERNSCEVRFVMLDLQAPRFTQAAVLELLPELPSKTLQNWLSRNIVSLEIQNPGRQAKRLYTAYGVIVLGFMCAVIPKKISPSYSVQMGHQIANRALEYFDADMIAPDGQGTPCIIYPADNYQNVQRHFIKNNGEVFFLYPVEDSIDSHNWKRTVEAPFYEIIETDLFIINIINRILLWENNNSNTKVKDR